ncbi:binding of sperm to zona pellucida, partial [Pristimantis euphronides]
MENGKPICVKPQSDLCWASGDPHFRTLDNRYFDFMGTCTYIFAKVLADVEDLPNFTVLIKNDNRGNVRVSYVGQVTLLTEPHTIVAKKGEFGFVRVDNARKPLPISMMNGALKIFQSGNSVLMQLGNDMQLSYDWNHNIRMEVTRRYSGKMHGLCGNYNQNPKDDFQTPDGSEVSTPIALGASWMMEDNTFCWHDCRGPCLSCPSSSANKYSTTAYCGLINENDGPFSECHAIVDHKMYMENCVYDVCINSGFKKISCEAVQTYADTCQRAGVAIKDWRKAAGCPLQCPKDSTYKLCGSACPATCEDSEGQADCNDLCVEACECNPGFVLSEGKCIPKTRCGCSYNGFTYTPNQAFWNDTTCKQRCVCNEKTQKVECTNSPCKAQEECAVRNGIQNCYPRSFGVCTAFGDPHYISFDGTKFDFQGTCVYQLTALCDESRGLVDFKIWGRNQNRGNIKVSYMSELFIKVYGQEIEASRQHTNKVMINKRLINLPYTSDDGRFSFYRNPCSSVYTFDFGLKVTFDHNSIVRITVPSSYANALCGLCGNYNGISRDDLTPKDGLMPTDATTFGKSWKVQNIIRCRDDGSAVCKDLSSEEKRQKDTASECGVLMSPKGPFRECHKLVDPTSYFESCVFDYCVLQKRQTSFCAVMTSYVMACQEAGGTVYSWRSEKFCPFPCPAHSSYEICADACPVTCNGLSIPEGCDGNCTEGCACNDNFILSGDQCVPIAECGCTHNGVYYSVGDSVYDDDSCSQKCSCTEGGIMSCVPSRCSSTEECKIHNGVLGCFPRGSATCTASGYSHYKTFDSHAYDFGGHCSYVLAQSCGEDTEGRNLTSLRVTIKHEKRDSGPGSIKSVTVEVHQMTLTLNQGKKGIIQVNGVTTRLPLTLLNIRAECYGQGVVVMIDSGIVVRYNLQSHVSVTVPSNYMNRMCGLCANYNGVAEDDADKIEEITAFGNKWKVPGEPDEICYGCGDRDNPCPSCQEEKKKIFLQSINCGIISDPKGPFAKCHSEVNPESYVDDCVSDLCQTNGEDSNVLCNSVTVYADVCKFEGVTDITWRTEDFCSFNCEPHSHYTTCADMCSSTCASIYDTYECSDLCDEGCECNEGYVFDGQKCISLDECGCFDNGRYYQANEIVLTDDCNLQCTCNPITGLTCRNTSCPEGEQCQIVDGVRTCVNPDPCKSKTCRTKETCKLQDGVAHCIPDYTGTCWAWGDPHYGTFDNHNFDFQGTCKYILCQHLGNDPTLPQFQVLAKNNNRGNQAVSYVKRIEIRIYGMEIAMEVGELGKIRVNGESTNLPVVLADGKLKVFQSGLSAIMEEYFGLQVTFDYNWNTRITLPSSYFNDVSGMCGNFNQDPNDDQKSPNGTLIQLITPWASSWKMYDQDPFCFDHCPGNCPTCDEAKKQQYSSGDHCGLILQKNGPFQECIPKVNPNKFFDACLVDVCMTNGAKNILCQSLETFASACLNQGVKPFDWRTPSNCPKICEDKNSHYNACGNACPASCFDRNAAAKCTRPCVETCECNTGMVLSGDKCVPTSNCGCQYNGRYYDPDQSWYNEKCSLHCKCDSHLGIVVCKETKCKDSETCLLTNGIRGCYPKKHSTCIASGDPHYTTFDNRKIDFMGKCTYLLAGVTSKDPSLVNFSIKSQNENRGNKAVSFIKTIILDVYNVKITLSRDHPGKMKVNERFVNLPYYSGTGISAFMSANHLTINTDFDMQFSFDGWSHARVKLPSTYMQNVGGLCGNYNGDSSDDLHIKDGVEATSAEEYGNYWKVGGEEGCEAICSDCPKCSEADKEPYKSEKYCGLLMKPDGPFSQCHDAIDPTRFFSDCLFDACAYKGLYSVVCDSIAAYASECQRNDSAIKKWRTESFCSPICPPNSHYEYFGNGCPVTCFHLIPPRTCVNSYTEGCYCDNDFIMSGGDCVHISECGCVYDNVYYKRGQEFFPDDLCQKKCTCGENGKTTCQAHTCGINEECKVVDGILGCQAKEFGQCIAWGDPHYITFDKAYYDMQGTCSYILVKVITKTVKFVVIVKNEPYGSVAITNSVTVLIGNDIIHLQRGSIGSIQVNRELYNVPCKSEKGKFWITQEGSNVIIQTTHGFTILFNPQSFVSVWVPSSYASKTLGLCGDFDNDPRNDFRLPNGTLVTDVSLFTDFWTEVSDGSTCRGCSGSQCPTCSEAATAEAHSTSKCGMISDPQGPFKDCHALVPPKEYAESCVFDICAGRGGQENLCSSLNAYTVLCQEKGATIQPWREIAGCPLTCPANSKYSLCTRTRDFNCYGLLASIRYTDRCYEGCECDDGYILDGNHCVPINHCGCVMQNGRYLKINESVRNEDCSEECTCKPEVGLTCLKWTCAEDEKCQLLDGVRSCVSTDPCKFKTCRLWETCKVQNEKAVCVPNYIGQCWAWGDPHFQTLDEKQFSFQGTCSYMFAQCNDVDPTLEPFSVIIKSDSRGNQASSFVRSMQMTIYGYKIGVHLGEFPKIRVNEEMTNLPVRLAGGKINVTRSGLTAVIETECNVTVTFDWNWHVITKIPSSYHNSISGLCGNFNQDPNDDHKSPNGTQVSSITEWAASWKIYDRDPFCYDHCSGQCPTCEESKKKLYGGNDYCGILFKTDGPFRDCITKVSPNKFFDGCLYDICTNDGARNILCRTLETYASTCLSQRVKIYDWRTSMKCPKICEDKNSHYNACGNACPASCSDRNAPAKCTKPCVETCECNEHMVFSGNRCVSISSCGCQHMDRYYEPNESWFNDKCNELCKCDPTLGIVKCQESSCKEGETCMVLKGRRGCHPTEYSTCVASGDTHYWTFDGRHFSNMGSCMYEMVKVTSNDSSLVNFRVLVVKNNWRNKAVSFTDNVIIEIYGRTITMSTHHPQQVKVDGLLRETPYYHANEQRTLIGIYSSGNKIVINTDYGITLTYDSRNYKTITVPSAYKGAVNGLCGNNNGDPSDELTTADGRIVQSALEFAKSWKVADVHGCTDECSDCPNCSEADKEPYKSEEYCGLLIKPDGPFSPCHNSLDPIPFFTNCLFDACAYRGHQSMVCDSISTYTSECHKNGSQIKEWRTPSFCEWTCPQNSHYELSGNGCPSTCYGLTSPLVCEKSPTEGCYCNNGFLLSGQDCVPLAECGCVFGNNYYKLGQEFFKDGLCQEKCTCGNDGKTTCQAHTCGINEECKVVDGILGCQAKEFGQCIAWGDPHYITFDKAYYDMQGTCSYILVKVITKTVNFVVIVGNEPYGNVAVTRSVTVIIGNDIIHLERGRRWSMEVNGERYNVPCKSLKREYWINQEGNNVIIQTTHGFKVLSDKQYYVSVWVPSSYAGLTSGLCGNYNKNSNDDFRLPNGTIATDVQLFGQSWTVSSDGSTCRGCSGSQCSTCSEAETAEAKSPFKCGMIADPQGPFKGCHALVPPERYVDNCIYDVCAGRDGQEALCADLQAYTALCQEKGANIEPWRNITGCPHSCLPNSHYEVCSKTCAVTCNVLFAPSTCSKSCYEGCQCDSGYMSSGENCVEIDQCGCNLNGRYIMPNERVLSRDCTQACTCSAAGGLMCEDTACASDETCQINKGVVACVPKDLCKTVTCRIKETCKIQNGNPVCVPNFSGTCWAWGDPHYHTFDGYNFDFQGTCTYVLVKYGGGDSGLVPFSIEEKNDNRGTQAVSYVRTVNIYVYGYKISIVKGEFGKVRVNDVITNLPLTLLNGKLSGSISGLNAVISTDFGLQVTYEYNWHVVVTLSSSYYGLTQGLCGNFNQNSKDELITADNKAVTTILDWAKSWKINDRDPFCFDSCPGRNCPTCDDTKKKQYGSDNQCGLISKADGPFRECYSVVSPDTFFDNCLYDVCINKGAKQFLCQALNAYANTCRKQGAQIYDWRTPSGCVLPCPVNSHYEFCGNACPATCTDRTAPSRCTFGCVETCQCNDGFVLSSDKCVPASGCGCSYNGAYYQPNQEFWADDACRMLCKCDPSVGMVVCKTSSCKTSERCMITNGVRGCQPISFDICQGSGDPHYTTFDGKKFDFMGTCIYQLVGVLATNLQIPYFNVTVQNYNRGGNKAVSYAKVVTVQVYNIVLTLSREYPRRIFVNGVLTSLPFYYQANKVVVYISGNRGIIKTDFDVTITYDWNMYVAVKIPSTYQNAVGGLCGNYNKNPNDDLTMSDGKLAPNSVQFGNSWKVGDVSGCSPGCTQNCPVCSDAQKQVYTSDKYCGMINKANGPFSQCYKVVDPTPYFNDCLFDTCQYQGYASSYCEAISLYVAACQDAGVTLQEWRSPSFCSPSCSPNSHYELCGNSCPVTCYGLSRPTGCDAQCMEGCYCDDGYVISGDTCVPAGNCGCVYQEKYYQMKQIFYPSGQCSEKCQCGADGIVRCKSIACGPNEECKLVNGVWGCQATSCGKCMASGDPHYTSFDGLRFDFQGTCTYMFAKVIEDDSLLEKFSVVVENESYGNGKVAVTRLVVVTVYGYKIAIERGSRSTVKVDDELFKLPLVLGYNNIVVNQEGNHVIIQTDFELKILYDTVYYVLLGIPSSYSGKMGGLCGNFNGDKTDDFQLPNKQIAQKVTDFGFSWKVNVIGAKCSDGCNAGECPVCTDAMLQPFKATSSCGMITNPSGPFASCFSAISPVNFFNDCVYDSCTVNGKDDILCKNLQAYAAACQALGITIGSWRTPTFCPMACSANSHYELCTRTCDQTCFGLDAPTRCTERCFEGCACNDGYVLDGDRCVTMNNCGCVYNGRYMSNGDSFVTADCTKKCSCQAGGVTCTSVSCGSKQVCGLVNGIRGCYSVEGDCTMSSQSFSTFDGLTGGPIGNGPVEVVSLCDSKAHEWFRIIGDIQSCGTAAASVARLHVFLATSIVTISKDKEAWVNGRLETFPVVSGIVSANVGDSSVSIQIGADLRLELTYSGNLAIHVSAKLSEAVCGACGNFNGDVSDDLKSPGGNAVTNVLQLIASWRAQDLNS